MPPFNQPDKIPAKATSLPDKIPPCKNTIPRSCEHENRTWKSRIDRPSLILVAILILTALNSREQFLISLNFVMDSLIGVSLFLVATFVLTSWVRASNAENALHNVFQGKPITAIFISTIAGAVTPLCSVMVIPLITSLLRSRVSLAVVMAFWISSPIISPEYFILTIAVVDTKFAVARFLSAILLGLGSGFVTHFLIEKGFFQNTLLERIENKLTSDTFEPNRKPVWNFWKFEERREIFYRDFIKNSVFLSKWLVLIFFIESLMIAYIPIDLIAGFLGKENQWGIVFSTLIGIPSYLNGVAAIGLVKSLIEMGMNPAGGLAFIVGGAVTSMPAMLAVFSIVRRNIFILYVTMALTGSIICGYVFQFVLY